MWILLCLFFFFNDTATTEIYTLSLHDALPIFTTWMPSVMASEPDSMRSMSKMSSTNLLSRSVLSRARSIIRSAPDLKGRSEEHTSELQSRQYLVCRLLLEKKKTNVVESSRRIV